MTNVAPEQAQPEHRSEHFDVIYFYSNLDGTCKAGFTTHFPSRHASHLNEGRRLLAVLPASFDDERRLHADLRAGGLLVRGKETYEGPPLFEYITGLLARNYAASSYQAAANLPKLPYVVWGWGADLSYTAPNGQMSILEGFDPIERVEYVSELAWLSSASDEWYTPAPIIESARGVMGGIDTDPASSAAANQTVKAATWYGREQDGLDPRHPWHGSVWLNPPYGKGSSAAQAFVSRLVDELGQETVEQAITCLNLNSGSAHWFDSVWDAAAIHCIYRGRINFQPPDRSDSTPTKGTIFSYFGPRVDEFKSIFGLLGRLVVVEQT